MVLCNAYAHDTAFTLPPGIWRVLLDSSAPGAPRQTTADGTPYVRDASGTVTVPAHALVLAVEVR